MDGSYGISVYNRYATLKETSEEQDTAIEKLKKSEKLKEKKKKVVINDTPQEIVERKIPEKKPVHVAKEKIVKSSCNLPLAEEKQPTKTKKKVLKKEEEAKTVKVEKDESRSGRQERSERTEYDKQNQKSRPKENQNRSRYGEGEGGVKANSQMLSKEESQETEINYQKMMTLDEWRALRPKRSLEPLNLRKAGEGEDLSQWQNMVEIRKKDDSADETTAEDHNQINNRKRQILDIHITFVDRRGPRDSKSNQASGNNWLRRQNHQQTVPCMDDDHDFPVLA